MGNAVTTCQRQHVVTVSANVAQAAIQYLICAVAVHVARYGGAHK